MSRLQLNFAGGDGRREAHPGSGDVDVQLRRTGQANAGRADAERLRNIQQSRQFGVAIQVRL